MTAQPGTITALTPQRKRSDRINVFIDGAFAFGLTEDLAHTLSIGQVLDAAAIARLADEDDLAETKRRAMNYVMSRPRSIVEMERYLQRKEVPEPVSRQVIDYLCARDYLDDRAFCRYWIEQRRTFKPRSAFALRRELQAKGVGRTDIDAALAEYDDDSAAYAAAEQRAQRWAHLPWAEFEVKMGRFLQSRGFRYDIIRDVAAQVWETFEHADGDLQA